MPLQIGIFGRGRLGSAIAAAAERTTDLDVSWITGRDEDTSSAGPVDVALDVSHADAVAGRIAWARETGTDLVIGTTGWDHRILDSRLPDAHLPTDASSEGHTPAQAGEDPAIGLLIAPNFSLTVALMRRLSLTLGRYAARSPEPVDLAVSEVHHTRKVDTPSGTALLLRDALEEGSGQRDVQATSLRLGEVIGRHDVHLSSAAESITLTHEAHSREVYALGALTAVRWIHGRRGTFTFDDLAAEILDPLFRSTPPAHAIPTAHPTPPQKEEP